MIKTESMKKVYISHKAEGYQSAYLTALNGVRFMFQPQRLSKPLQKKLIGFSGVIELTLVEAKEVYSTMRSTIIKADNITLLNLFGKNK